MAKAETQYQRLPGRKSGLLRRDTLWLGPDHLLYVRSSRFTEDYRRFYLADIQAIVLQQRPTRSRAIVDQVAIGVSLVAMALLFLTGHPVWGSLLAMVAAPYAWFALRREDCKTWLQTAVGTAELPSLCRIKSTTRALAIIDEKIRAAQPAMPAQELQEAVATPPPLPFMALVSPPPLPPPLPAAVDAAREPSPLYVAGFVYLLAFGVLKMYVALSPAFFLKLVWVSAAGYLCFPVLVLIPLVRYGLKNIRGARTAAVLTSMVVTGSLGTYAISWATSRGTRKMQTAEVQKIYETLENAMPLQVGLAAVVLGLAIWGLLVFLMSSAPSARRPGNPLTLFGPENS